jgi:exodeoxyribonuclease V beta subunit
MNAPSQFDPLLQELSGATSIEASAGTGKTYSITLLWLRLLVEQQLRVDQILVSTFTQAATAELRERLLASLRRAHAAARALADGDEPSDSPEARIIRRWLDSDPTRCAALAQHLNHSLSAFDLAPIQTLHGFCQSLISRHSLELACDPDLKLQENCDRILEQITDDYLMELSDDQSPEASPLRRVAHTVQARPAATVRGVDLNLDELREAKQALLGQITLEAPSAIRGLTQSRTRTSVQNRVTALVEKGRWEKFTDPQIQALPPEFCRLWSEYRRVDQSEKQVPASGLAQRIQHELPQRKTLAGLRTFDDILLTVRDALTAQGTEGAIARAVRSRIRAAILDECQDSDTLQIQVFQSLFVHPDTESFLIIGDPKQSIYRFRGADLASYRSLARAVRSAPRMTVNHRSDPSLVAAINHLYGPAFRFPDSLAGDTPIEYVPVTAQAPDNRISDPAQRLAVVLQWSPESDRQRAPNRLAGLAAHEIARLLHKPVTIVDRHSGLPRRVLPGDIGVLASNHRELRRVRRALQTLGIPCQSSGKGLGCVFESDEALDVLAWLELLAALHHHGQLLGRLSAFLLCPLGVRSATEVLELQNHPTSQAEQLQRFLQAEQELSRVGPLPPLLRWMNSPEVTARTLAHADGERRMTNWRQVAGLLQSRFDRGHRSAESLAAWLSRQSSQAPDGLDGASGESTLMRLETDASAVQLNTIHGAKGLEYPIVFCPFLVCVRGRNPAAAAPVAVARLGDAWVVDVGSDDFATTRQTAEDQESEEEHRRLYVALTRARHRLYLGVAPIAGSARGPAGNSAADSPLARLPGLASDAMDQWPDRWSALAPAGIQFLDSTRPGSPVPVAIPRTPDQDPLHPIRTEPTGAPAAPSPLLKPYPFPGFSVRSFTSLSRSDTDHDLDLGAADRDLSTASEATPGTADPSEALDVLATLGAAGSLLGDQLHRALEDHLGNGRTLEQVASGQEHPEAWIHALEHLLASEFHLGPEVRVRLGDLRGQGITEMQFHLPVGGLSPAALSDVLLHDPGVRRIPGGPDWAESLQHWSFPEFTGFLQGFIDLIFERDGRWYVADYKSNRLPRYTPSALDRVMLESHYLLQARIYLLALHRHLRSHLPGYDPDQHLGGVAYLFVRGFPGQGVWFEAPCRAALDRFDLLFQGSEPRP